MADRWDETIYGEEDVEEEEYEPNQEHMLFLIDASPAMLEPCDVRKKRRRAGGPAGGPAAQEVKKEEGGGAAPMHTQQHSQPPAAGGQQQQGGPDGGEQAGEEEEEEPDEEFEGLSWVEAAMRVAHAMCRQKVIAATSDQVAVLLYDTREALGDEQAGSWPNAYQFLRLESPTADSITRLDGFTKSQFEKKIGSAPPDTSKAANLKSALWLTKAVFDTQGKARAVRRILLFTRDQEPFKRFDRGVDTSSGWNALTMHLRGLAEMGVGLEIYPMMAPSDPPFQLGLFWRPILQQLRGVGMGEVEYEDAEAMEEAEQIGHIGDLVRFVRSKAHKKRAVGSFLWALGPGFDVAVKMYQMFQKQGIPSARKVHGLNAAEVKAYTGQVNEYTGADVRKEDLRRYFPRKDCGLPKVYFTNEELDALKGKGNPGMALLGFKPRSCLKEYHQIRNSSFIFPDDKKQPGSATAFIALHAAMLKSGRMAVCRLASNRARTPQLVALLPAEEVVYEDGTQVEPPGFHAIWLPYSDDIRAPETEPNFTGADRPQPSEEAIAAGEELIATLRMPNFYAGGVKNPALQRHYEVLEAKATEEEIPDVEEAVEADETRPAIDEDEVVDEESGQTMGAIIQAFRDAVGVSDDVKKAAKRKPVEVDAGAVAALGVEDMAASGGAGALKGLKNDELKAWLRAHGCPVGGKKEELIARVLNKLGL